MMKHAFEVDKRDSVTAIMIVDTFTKLIFGEESSYDDREMQIIQALRKVDDNVGADSRSDLGVYLRALGVEEMIALVSRVQKGLSQGVHLDGALRSPPTSSPDYGAGRHSFS